MIINYFTIGNDHCINCAIFGKLKIYIIVYKSDKSIS